MHVQGSVKHCNQFSLHFNVTLINSVHHQTVSNWTGVIKKSHVFIHQQKQREVLSERKRVACDLWRWSKTLGIKTFAISSGKFHSFGFWLDEMKSRFNWITGAIGFLLLFGFMFLTIGIITTKFTLFEVVLRERLQMSRIYPSYFWWKNPEPEVLLDVYIFNITNSADFIAGRDKKLKLQEIGPIRFQEILEHSDVEFHSENSTMSYTVTRRIVFKESENIKGILNQTVIVPNMASLSGCSHVSDNFFLRTSFNTLLMLYGTRPVVNTTIYNYLFNLTDPILEFTEKIVPFLVPTKDTGILQNVSYCVWLLWAN